MANLNSQLLIEAAERLLEMDEYDRYMIEDIKCIEDEIFKLENPEIITPPELPFHEEEDPIPFHINMAA